MEWTLKDYEEAAKRGQADWYWEDGTAYFNTRFTDRSGFEWSAIRVDLFDDDVWAHPVPFLGY